METNQSATTSEVMNADEAAVFLKMPKSTLLKLCADGELPGLKIGRQWRFNRAALEKWASERTGDEVLESVGEPVEIEFSEKLANFGVNFHPSKIINSSMGVVYLLRKRFPQPGPVFIIGEAGTFTALEEAGYFYSEKDPLAVVVGFDRNINYEKFVKANKFIRAGAIFYGTNPDFTFPTPDGLIPGSGPFIAFVQAACDQVPIIAGKPSPYLFDLCFEELGLQPNEIIGIGDRLETDILGAQRSGCHSGLVLSGVATLEDSGKWSPPPDIIASDLVELIG